MTLDRLARDVYTKLSKQANTKSHRLHTKGSIMKAKRWQVVHHTLTHAKGVLLNKTKNIAYVLFDNERDVRAIPLHQIVVITHG